MRRGFTLIELLVVIAIIAILAAILFPVFVKARSAANRTKCASHGREIGMAMMMYLDDNNGRFPSEPSQADLDKLKTITWIYSWPGDPRPGHDVWDASMSGGFRYLLLGRYIKNQDVWICPEPNGLYSLKFAKGYRCSWTFLTRQFMYNPQLAKYPDTAFQTETRMGDRVAGIGRTMAEIQGLDIKVWQRYVPPAKKICVFCYALGPDVSWLTETYENSGRCEPPLFPHSEGTIYVYFDGHSKWSETGCGWAPVRYTTSNIDRPHPKT